MSTLAEFLPSAIGDGWPQIADLHPNTPYTPITPGTPSTPDTPNIPGTPKTCRQRNRAADRIVLLFSKKRFWIERAKKEIEMIVRLECIESKIKKFTSFRGPRSLHPRTKRQLEQPRDVSTPSGAIPNQLRQGRTRAAELSRRRRG